MSRSFTRDSDSDTSSLEDFVGHSETFVKKSLTWRCFGYDPYSGSLTDHYVLGQVLGKGAYGEVRAAKLRGRGQLFRKLCLRCWWSKKRVDAIVAAPDLDLLIDSFKTKRSAPAPNEHRGKISTSLSTLGKLGGESVRSMLLLSGEHTAEHPASSGSYDGTSKSQEPPSTTLQRPSVRKLLSSTGGRTSLCCCPIICSGTKGRGTRRRGDSVCLLVVWGGGVGSYVTMSLGCDWLWQRRAVFLGGREFGNEFCCPGQSSCYTHHRFPQRAYEGGFRERGRGRVVDGRWSAQRTGGAGRGVVQVGVVDARAAASGVVGGEAVVRLVEIPGIAGRTPRLCRVPRDPWHTYKLNCARA